METFYYSLYSILQYDIILALLGGAMLGIIVGAVPGLEPAGCMAMLLPYSMMLPPLPGVILLLGVYSGAWYGGAIPAIIMRVPGTPVNVLTTYDGYPMARRGQTRRALSIAYSASFFGGMVSVMALVVLAPHLARVATYFGAPEYAMVALLAIVSVLLAHVRYPLASLLSLGVGLFLATVGIDEIFDTPRFVFGNETLLAGIPLIPVVIGLFSMSQAFVLLRGGTALSSPTNSAAKKTARHGYGHEQAHGRLLPDGQAGRRDGSYFLQRFFRNYFSGFVEISRYPKTLLRSTTIGLTLGLLPGVGEFGAQFLSYALAQRGSKNPKKFGKGSAEGLVASESSISACTATTMVPLLSLGIPTDPLMAMVLSVMLIHNYIPGPQLFIDHPTFLTGLYVALFLVNIFIFILLSLGTSSIMKISKINLKYVGMLVLVLSLVGTYVQGYRLSDCGLAALFALMGWVMLKNNIPGFPLVIGLVLGTLLENNTIRALLINQESPLIFFQRPIAATLLVVSLLGMIIYLRGLYAEVKYNILGHKKIYK
ncbi:MAG: tripartite tricarboxylate transporter permease [Hydrotalea sp.]|nr:tripartite tricarboxylate transporter permease [Hydrotalea sp.]